jgi:hypothetical protein
MTLGGDSSLAAFALLTCAAGALAWVSVEGQAPAAASCRTYSADEVRTLTGATSGTINQTCHFDRATYKRLCTIRSRTSASSFTLNLTDTYTSVADFVDEIHVIPPIARIQKQTRRFANGPAANADVTYEYDGRRRQTRLSTAINNNLLVMTYNAWDALGRPTGGVSSSRASTVTLHYAYDDIARTMTITGPAGVEVDTYDGDGNMIHEIATDGSGRTDFAIRIVTHEMVCR